MPPNKISRYLARILAITVALGAVFWASHTPSRPATCEFADIASPPYVPASLVIDLDGDGVELTDVNTSKVMFDQDINGFAEVTGWVTSDDGFLVFDRNGNKQIDNSLELFGRSTDYDDGFALLSQLDTDRDGAITNSDGEFSKLFVWRDLQRNAIVDFGEVADLASYGIAEIDLSAQEVDELNQGNQVILRGRAGLSDGKNLVVEAVKFRTNITESAKLLAADFEISDEAYLQPLLFGHGRVASTLVAFTERPELLAQSKELTNILQNGDVSLFAERFEDFFLDWAGVRDVVPGSRGEFVDAKHLELIEAIRIGEFRQFDTRCGVHRRNPNDSAGQMIEYYYQGLKDAFMMRYMAQSAKASILVGEADPNSEEVSGTHPLLFLQPLTLRYSPKKPVLDGNLNTVFDEVFSAVSSGNLKYEEAGLILMALRYDLGENDRLYFEQLRDLLNASSHRAISDNIFKELEKFPIGF